MASLSDISIRRPVLTTVMSVGIVLLGIIGFLRLGVREFPSVDPPIINVSANYPGASADVMESQVTEPLEESINGISGIRTISSSSAEGRVNITVEFDLDVDLEAAANDVRDRVSRVQRQLPADMDPVQVAKADANSNSVAVVNIQSSVLSDLDRTALANDVFKERLQTIPGVASVQIWGEKRYAMRLWLDPARMAAYNLTPLDVQQALGRENVELPSGRIEGSQVELSIRTLGRISTQEAFNQIVIRRVGDRVVRLEDIGEAKLDAENVRTSMLRDGRPANGIAVIPLPGANNIEIADEFYRRIEEIKKDLPPHVTVEILVDNTRFIRLAIAEVAETLLIAFLLVVAVIFLFLRDWRTTVIPMVAVPVSLVGSFFLLYVLGFSINVLTLLGLVLAIGLVVDDAIVVLENIYSKIEAGMNPMRAAHEGTREIFVAVVATTVVLAAVFLPIIFMEGLNGRLFREFGVVVAGSVVISAFVALTLTPMMSARLLKHRAVQPWFYRKTEPFFQRLTDNFTDTLRSFMRARWLAWVILMGASAGMVGFALTLPQELAPLEDRSQFRIQATAPEGASFDFMDAYMQQITKLAVDSVSERQGMITVTAPGFAGSGASNTGFIYLVLKDQDQRQRSQQQIADMLTREFRKIPNARAFVSQPQTITTDRRGGGLPVQFVVQAPSFDSLSRYLPAFVQAAQQHDAFQFVDVDLKFNKPELQVEIDRAKARTLGVSVLDIARTLQLNLSEARYGYFIREGKQYQVIGQVLREDRNTPTDLRSMYVRGAEGQLIQLDNLVRLREQSTPPQIYRFNRFVSATVSAALNPGYTQGDGIRVMEQIKNETLPEGFRSTLSGSSRDFAESSSSLLFAFGLAIVIIYLILAAQFESFRDPLTIFSTVPLAIFGALFCLWYFQQTLNIFSQIGIIMLIGLVTKNGILIVEFANQRREQFNEDKMTAAVEASAARFRPILMTSLCTAFGFLPIALALGAGAESRVGMGIAVVGGVLFSTAVTLYVTPALYTFLSPKHIAQPSDTDEQLPTAQSTEFHPQPAH